MRDVNRGHQNPMGHRITGDLLEDILLALERLPCPGQIVKRASRHRLLNAVLHNVVLAHLGPRAALVLARCLRLLRHVVVECIRLGDFKAPLLRGLLPLEHGTWPNARVCEVLAMRNPRLSSPDLLVVGATSPRGTALEELEAPRVLPVAMVLCQHLHQHIARIQIEVRLQLAALKGRKLFHGEVRSSPTCLRAHERLAAALATLSTVGAQRSSARFTRAQAPH